MMQSETLVSLLGGLPQDDTDTARSLAGLPGCQSPSVRTSSHVLQPISDQPCKVWQNQKILCSTGGVAVFKTERPSAHLAHVYTDFD